MQLHSMCHTFTLKNEIYSDVWSRIDREFYDRKNDNILSKHRDRHKAFVFKEKNALEIFEQIARVPISTAISGDKVRKIYHAIAREFRRSRRDINEEYREIGRFVSQGFSGQYSSRINSLVFSQLTRLRIFAVRGEKRIEIRRRILIVISNAILSGKVR